MEPDKTDLTTSVKDSKVTNSQGSFVGEQQTNKEVSGLEFFSWEINVYRFNFFRGCLSVLFSIGYQFWHFIFSEMSGL